MSKQHQEFRARLEKLGQKHSAIENGYVARVQSDGLIVVTPRKSQSRFSPRVLVLFVAAFLLFKGFLMAALGFDSYNERVANLAAGTTVEWAGAMVMQSDPASVFVAQKIGPILR